MSNYSNSSIYVSRTKVRKVGCPYCRSGPGEKCVGTRGPRESNHMERVDFYISLQDGD